MSEQDTFAPIVIQQEMAIISQRQQQIAARIDTMGVLLSALTTRIEGMSSAATYEVASIRKDVLDLQNRPARFEKLITPFIIINASLSLGTMGLVVTIVILLVNHLLGK